MRDLICPPRLSLVSCHGEKLKEPTIQANITIHFNQSIDFVIVHMGVRATLNILHLTMEILIWMRVILVTLICIPVFSFLGKNGQLKIDRHLNIYYSIWIENW